MTFTSGTTTLCSEAVSSGVASCSTGILPPGTYPVTATYSGDVNHLGSTATSGFVIEAKPVLALTVSGAPSSIAAGGSFNLDLGAAVSLAGGPAEDEPVLSLQLPSGESFAAVPAEAGWDCAISAEASTITCTSTAVGPIAAGTSLPTLTVLIDVAPSATGTLTLTASLSDPADAAITVGEVDATTVTDPPPVGTPDTGAATPPGQGELGLLLILAGMVLVVVARRRRERGNPDIP